jgi:DNA mismatch endonuclease (patch repair protein)
LGAVADYPRTRPAQAARPTCAPTGAPTPSPSSRCAAPCTAGVTGTARITGWISTAAKRVRPDIAFTARRVAVFVDGCFWHCCPEHGSKPAVNVGYWDPKLRRNVERDRAADTALAAAGWEVVRVWEHEPLEAAVAAVLAALAISRP